MSYQHHIIVIINIIFYLDGEFKSHVCSYVLAAPHPKGKKKCHVCSCFSQSRQNHLRRKAIWVRLLLNWWLVLSDHIQSLKVCQSPGFAQMLLFSKSHNCNILCTESLDCLPYCIFYFFLNLFEREERKRTSIASHYPNGFHG